MKKSQKIKLVAQMILVVGFVACDGSSSTNAGSGPSFSSLSPKPTAADLYLAVSKGTCDVTQSERTLDVDCPGGGKVHIVETNTSTTNVATCTFTECVGTVDFGGRPEQFELKLNGESSQKEVRNSLNITSEELNQSISFSGDLGFAADCDLLYDTPTSGSPSFTGSCKYVDSDGEELSITATEVLAL